MAKLGVNDLVHNGMPSLPFECSVAVSMIEVDMLRQQPAPVRTYELLKQIREGHPDAEIKFAIGPDIPDEFDRWSNVNRIEAEFGFVKLPVQSMRATKLRQMVREGVKAWRQHVPRMVARYIEMHGLYAEEETR
jgi:nicotinic acid mononucleotide adenylyltransferase